MKKSLILAGICTFLFTSSMSIATAADTATQVKPKSNCTQNYQKEMKRPPHKGPNLDERLKLTDEQKAKAKDIRMQGHEKIKPVFEQIKAKKDEIKTIKSSNLSAAEQEKKIASLKADIKKLKIEAKKIRQENMQEFEAILTPDQKTEFEKIKQEGRENFKKYHKKGHKCNKFDSRKMSEPTPQK